MSSIRRRTPGRRRHLRPLLPVLTAVLALLAASAPAALADDVVNSLDDSVDSVAEVMSLNVDGDDGTTTLYVVPTGGDGKQGNGCNLTGQTTLVLSISSSAPGIATVSPSSVTFTSCGDVKALTITPVAQGTATISATQTSNSTDGSFNLAPSTFTVNVAAAAPANTAPSLVVSGVTEGASYAKGSVPAATCQVTDAEDGNSSFAATLSAVTGTYASDGIGSQTASCAYTDDGGLPAASSVTYSIIDPTAPEISYDLTPATPGGSHGWYRGDVTLTWHVSDADSPHSLSTTGCVDQSITADQAEDTYSCAATSAGGSTGPVDVAIKRDATKPTISGAASPGANAHGWNNTGVTVTFTCSDATSGVDTCLADGESGPATTLTAEGAGQSASGTATDVAGNTATATVSGINIDTTAPSVALVDGPQDGGVYYYGFVPLPPTCDASDGLSGLDGACATAGYSAAVGTHTVSASASDRAGNGGSDSATYEVRAWTLSGFYAPVDMGGVVNTVKGGSTVPLKFEVFAGPTELTSPSVVKSFTTKKVNCDGTATQDAIETLATTGGTSLRYDTTAGQFIQNWKTPPGGSSVCYTATVTTQDDSAITAFFKLK